MKITITIRDKVYEARQPYPHAKHVEIPIDCPLCKAAAPMKLIGHEHSQQVDHDTITTRADAYCCGPGAGIMVVKVDTLFGIKEDEAVMSRARVY